MALFLIVCQEKSRDAKQDLPLFMDFYLPPFLTYIESYLFKHIRD